ncbi:MAG: response regulator [Alphaproteobacteria bacterium]|nr:response regulator [Alphaproteobacteria bacterium]
MSETVTEARPLEGARILLVEDSAIIALDLQDTLQSAGAGEVVIVATPAQALGHLSEGAGFACAVLDLRLGRETSLPVAEALADRRIPFLFVSGYGNGPQGARFADRAVIAKPVDPLVLLAEIVRLLAR